MTHDSVTLCEEAIGWSVTITENGVCSMTEFGSKELATSFASFKAARLQVSVEKSPSRKPSGAQMAMWRVQVLRDMNSGVEPADALENFKQNFENWLRLRDDPSLDGKSSSSTK